MDVAGTERLWLTEPRRTTCLAKVTAVRGNLFALDRSLFAPTSDAHRHSQPMDQGTVWWEGEKRRLVRVVERGGTLWHELRGTVPDVGVQLQCHLDAERREKESRAHTAMHLWLKALSDLRAPPHVADPQVKGGGTFRLDLQSFVPAPLLAQARQQVEGWIAQDLPVTVEHLPRGFEAQELTPQSFAPPNPYPGPDTTLSVVRIGKVCAYPCDGTHVARTRAVGATVVAQAQPTRNGFMLVCRVKD
ncbi:MAG: misacylated tRNA(Ala) deacylase [Thermoplasmata archaeon]|nr:misacylated tRNA(Ala) deacylase [Thermoplasmata archaeon]